jgi:hypothetical protein
MFVQKILKELQLEVTGTKPFDTERMNFYLLSSSFMLMILFYVSFSVHEHNIVLNIMHPVQWIILGPKQKKKR